MTTGTTDNSTYADEQASLAQVLAIAATIDAVRRDAAARGIRVLHGTSQAQPVGADLEPGDLYGPADEN